MHDERFQRTLMMIGPKKMALLNRAHVTIVGLGAVGSHALEALARIGIGQLRLIDSENVKPSNINRQLIAVEDTVGMKKTEAARQRVLAIHPDCRVEAMDGFVAPDTMAALLSGRTDFVVDAIDSLNPKVHLIQYLLESQTPFISSMGASRRMDPLAVTMGDLNDVTGCQLASKIRKRLRRMGYDKGIRCVYSTEHAEKSTIGASPENMTRGRARYPNGSLSFIPGIFGYMAAGEAVRFLLGKDGKGK